MIKQDDSKKRRNRIIKITIIIIIILLLITSCSVIRHFGRIGKYCKEDSLYINDKTNEEKINLNDKLQFDLIDYTKPLILYLEDGNYKLSYTAEGFKSKKYTCKTSDPKIATCKVKNGYVIIYPKKRGEITLTVSTKTNGYKYIAQTKVEIKGGSTAPVLSKTKPKAKKTKSKVLATATTKITKSSNESKIIKKSSDARLSYLKINNGEYEIAPTFNKDITEYVVVVPNNIDKVNISGKPSSNLAKILSGLGDITLTENSKEIQIKVKAEDGTIKTYTIKINKKDNINRLSTDATLKEIKSGGYTITPSFSANTFKYEITVPNSVTKLDLNAIPNYSGSLVTITGNSNFKVGKNEVKIKVTAENGDMNTYTIIINKLDKDKVNTNANLTSLEVEGYTITPNFNKNTYEYHINGTIPKNINKLIVSATAEDEDAKITITGNKNLKEGENTISVTITSKDGVKKTYTIIANKEITEKLSDFYITSPTQYKVGYRPNSNQNYKNIILDSNILDDIIDISNVTKTKENGITKLTLSDGNSYIILESKFDLDYLIDLSITNSYAIKVSYDDMTNGKVRVTGYRKGINDSNQVDSYDINFDIERQYSVIINAGEIDSQKGFFNSFADQYELVLYEGETLDLSPYNHAYIYKDQDKCKSYKLIGYDTNKTKTENPEYKLDETGKINPKIIIKNDLKLYAIYDLNQTVDYKENRKLYISDVDIFTLPDGTKNFIYPGTEGSYIMRIKNTTNSAITLRKINIEEDTVCSSKNNCLNVGYIIKRYNTPNYTYYSPTNKQTNEYWIMNQEANRTRKLNQDGSYHHELSLDLNKIHLEKDEETEISLLWKWIHSDESDTAIGNYVVDKNDIYKLTLSFDFDKEDKICDK